MAKSCIRLRRRIAGMNTSWARRPVSEAIHAIVIRSEEHTSELQSSCNLVCRLLLEKSGTQLLLGRAVHSKFRLVLEDLASGDLHLLHFVRPVGDAQGSGSNDHVGEEIDLPAPRGALHM